MSFFILNWAILLIDDNFTKLNQFKYISIYINYLVKI